MNSPKTTYFSRLLCEEHGGGGEKRVHQIYTLFSKHVELEVVAAPSEDIYTETLTDSSKYAKPQQQYLLNRQPLLYWSETYQNQCLKLHSIAQYWADHINNYQLGDFVIVDDPIYFTPLIDFLTQQNIPVIACLHNIESLVPHQVKKDYKVGFFEKELAYIKKCSAVLTISKEDELLLNNFDVKHAIYLPYTPSELVRSQLLAIRAQRKETQKKGLLYLGHMGNYPTKEGALAIGNHFINLETSLGTSNQLIIAGFGAEVLKESLGSAVINIQSDLSDTALATLLSTVKACICYQNQATGALTKIPELLIAGVPILGNSTALRNFHDLEGTLTFSNFDAISSLIPTVDKLNNQGFTFPIWQTATPVTSILKKVSKEIIQKEVAAKPSIKSDYHPKISILTPSFNTSDYLERAIKSVQVQQYKNWEHIIIDGGSTDGTIAILEKYPHLIWASEPDQGQSDAMNKAFARATGDLIVYLNADDELESDTFIEVVNYFEQHRDCMFLAGSLRSIHPDGQKEISQPSTHLIDLWNPTFYRFPLNPVSYFYKREVQKKIGPFPINNHYAMDYWFLLRAYWLYQPVIVDKVLGNFYFYPTTKSSDREKSRAELFKTQKEFLQDLLLEWQTKLNQSGNREEGILAYLLNTSDTKLNDGFIKTILEIEEKAAIIQQQNAQLRRKEGILKQKTDQIEIDQTTISDLIARNLNLNETINEQTRTIHRQTIQLSNKEKALTTFREQLRSISFLIRQIGNLIISKLIGEKPNK